MLRAIKECLLGAALLCSLGLSSEAQTPATPPPQNNLVAPPTPSATPQTVKNFVPVTDRTLRSPKPEDWLMLRGNYQGWGYSPLDQINKTNVKNLQLVWARVMEPGINEAAPIVYNGVMYLGNPADVIQAIDAVTGDLLWEFRHPNPTVEQLHSVWGQRKRSIALYGDRIYFVTWDNYVVALDARTAQQVWQTNRGGNLYATNSSGPIVVGGVVIAGSNCQVAAFGCFVTGHDARTGEELWRNALIPRPG
jgi:alcohol dehydrogenase (cytochrome c)